jgi:hypothetical protein
MRYGLFIYFIYVYAHSYLHILDKHEHGVIMVNGRGRRPCEAGAHQQSAADRAAKCAKKRLINACENKLLEGLKVEGYHSATATAQLHDDHAHTCSGG